MKDNDLISRAALLKDLSYCAPELWQDEEYIKAKIMKQPAVDAAPVIHARPVWINPLNPGAKMCTWKCSSLCSACGDYVATGWKYCPRCGAKMDGERRDA